MNDFSPLAEDALWVWELIADRHRFPSPGDENPSKDSVVERFLSGYRLRSLGGLTWGWLKIYHDLALALPRFHPGIRDLYRSGQAEAFARRVRAVADQALALFSPSYEETLERWSAWQEAAREEGGWAEGEQDFFTGYANVIFALGGYHPERTSYGTRVPYLKKDGRTFGFLNLNPDALPPSCPAGEYWPRLGASILPRWVGEMVSPADMPVDAREDRRFPQADDRKRTLEQACKLLDAAQADKRRVIPTGAIVQLPFGPFRSFEIHEVGEQVGFVARTHRGEFSLGYLHRAEDRWHLWWPCPLLIDLSQGETGSVINQPAIAAMKLLLAAVLHDFWTLEERTLEQVFANQNPKRVPGSLRAHRPADGAPRIVYLPQIVYAARPNLEACEQALELTKRARHPVRQHLRRSPTCSEKARLFAVQFGLPVPAGYTFVQPHWRGEGTARPTLYRSRSALACLHALQPQSAPKAGLRGLGFLEQVRDDLERHGHQVLSVTNYFGPNDCGVDIRTLRHGIEWTIRVKEKPPDAKVQELEVKAFADALPSDRARTGGMLVTNTGYTKAAEDLASKLGIHVLWGERPAFPP